MAVALPTSGTAATPRWVVRSTGSWVSSFPAVTALTGLDAGSRVWVPGPLRATMNLYAAVHAAAASAPLVEDARDATHTHLTPGTLTRLLDDGAPLAGRTVVVAGDRLSVRLHDRAVAAGARVHHYYGAAELSFVAWGPHADDLSAFPGVRVAVRSGLIWVRSPYVCSGYDGPAGPLQVADDGWATVGDHGELRDGRLTVLGRPSTIGVGGATVDTLDVERLLRAHARGEVCVIGLPHPTLGRVPAVVLTDARDHDRLRQVARAELADVARPRRWLHLEPLPLTPAGKVDRAGLLALASDGGGPARRLV